MGGGGNTESGRIVYVGDRREGLSGIRHTSCDGRIVQIPGAGLDGGI